MLRYTVSILDHTVLGNEWYYSGFSHWLVIFQEMLKSVRNLISENLWSIWCTLIIFVGSKGDLTSSGCCWKQFTQKLDDLNWWCTTGNASHDQDDRLHGPLKLHMDCSAGILRKHERKRRRESWHLYHILFPVIICQENVNYDLPGKACFCYTV